MLKILISILAFLIHIPALSMMPKGHSLLKKMTSIAKTQTKNIKKILPAETLFYKINNEPITQEEHDIIYDIKLKNQYPMCLEHNNVPEDELATIQEKLNKELPGVKVAFIPTTLYELLFLQHLYKNKDNIEEKTGGLIYESYDDQYDTGLFASSPLHRMQTEPFNFEEINRLKEVKNCHLILNNTIINDLEEKDILPENNQLLLNDNLLENSFLVFKQRSTYPSLTISFQSKPLNTLGCISRSKSWFSPQENSPISNDIKDFSNTIKKIIDLEQSWHKQNLSPLYRGSQRLPDSYQKSVNASLSFGNSVFAGCLFDSGANAYFHMAAKGGGYALPISKKYFNQNNFHVPPLVTLAGLASIRGFFHPRTKIKPFFDSTSNNHESRGIFDYKGSFPNYLIINASPDPEKTYKEIFSYIEKNAVILKNEHRTLKATIYCSITAAISGYSVYLFAKK